MTVTEQNQLQLQQIPRAGQLLMYIDLTAIENKSINESLTLLESMGYEPQLRYQGEKERVRLYALLRDEQLNPNQPIDDDYRLDERIALFEAFPGDQHAIFCSTGLPKRQPAAV